MLEYSFSYCISSSTLYTLYPHHLSPLCFFLSPVPCFLAQVTLYVFHLSFKEKSLSSVFMGLNPLAFTSSTVYIYYYYLFCQLSSLKQKCTLWRHALLLTIFLYFFPCGMYWPPLLLCLLWPGHIYHLHPSSPLFLCYNVWTLPFIVLYPLTPKTLHFFLVSFLPLYLDLFSYSIPHYSTCQYFKLVFGNWFSLFSFNAIPAVIGQVPKLPTTETFPPLSSF